MLSLLRDTRLRDYCEIPRIPGGYIFVMVFVDSHPHEFTSSMKELVFYLKLKTDESTKLHPFEEELRVQSTKIGYHELK